MSQTRDEINDFLMGGSGKAFDFATIGDTVTGVIVSMKKQQQTDFQTGAPQFWNDGSPKMMLMLQLQTDLHEDDDDEGLRNVYLRGGNFTAVKGKGTSSLMAVKDAVKRSGAPDGIQAGGKLTMQYSGEGPAPQRGMNPSKLYSAAYQAPTETVSLEDMA